MTNLDDEDNRMDEDTKTALQRIENKVDALRDDIANVQKEQAIKNENLSSTIVLVNKHENDLYGKDGIILQLQSLREIVGSAKKVGWELMKPFLYVIGVGIIIVTGILGMFIWQLSQLVSTIQHLPVP